MLFYSHVSNMELVLLGEGTRFPNILSENTLSNTQLSVLWVTLLPREIVNQIGCVSNVLSPATLFTLPHRPDHTVPGLPFVIF